MFRKVAMYGIAFGSMSAAMWYIQYVNGLYRERTFLSALPLISNIVLPGLGVFLFIKSISRMKSDKPINMGKALFGALLVCVLVAVCNIGVYQHVLFNRTDIVKEMRTLNYSKMEEFYKKEYPKDEAKQKEEIAKAKDNFEQNISTGSFARTEFSMCLSTGMVIALLTFLRTYRRQ